MKILLAGQFKKWALENHYARYLAPYAKVFSFPAEDRFDDFYHTSILHKIQYRIGFSDIYDKIGRELLVKTEEVQPDVVWVFKGMRIAPKYLRILKERGVKIVNYNPDHPFLFSSRGSGNANVTKSIGLFDLHLCYSHDVQRRIETEYGIPTAFLPFAYEMVDSIFEEVQHEPEISAACFIGNPDRIRAEYLVALANSGLPVDVYGHGWEQILPKSASVRIFDAVYGNDFWRKMRAYRLQINIFRPHNEGSHNMRTFEIPAVGGVMLAPDSPEHREFFRPGEEIFTYRSKAEMVTAAKLILELPATEVTAIRRRARSRSVLSGYSYEHRAGQAVEAFRQLLAGEMGLQPMRSASFTSTI
jgi:hypothetical protein